MRSATQRKRNTCCRTSSSTRFILYPTQLKIMMRSFIHMRNLSLSLCRKANTVFGGGDGRKSCGLTSSTSAMCLGTTLGLLWVLRSMQIYSHIRVYLDYMFQHFCWPLSKRTLQNIQYSIFIDSYEWRHIYWLKKWLPFSSTHGMTMTQWAD